MKLLLHTLCLAGFFILVGCQSRTTSTATPDLAVWLAEAERALAINPSNFEALLSRARAKDFGGDFAGAIADYDRYLVVNPTGEGQMTPFDAAPEPVNHAIKLSRARAVAGRAIVSASKALAENPNDAAAFAARARARLARGDYLPREDYDLVIADLDRAIERAPNDGSLFRDRAVARYRSRGEDRMTKWRAPKGWGGQFMFFGVRDWKPREQEAITSDLNRAIALNPRDAIAYVHRATFKRAVQTARDAPAQIAVLQGKSKQPLPRSDDVALPDLDRAIELDPRCVDALYDRAIIRIGHRDYEGALSDLTAALAADPGDFQAQAARAMARSFSGDKEGAAADAKIAGSGGLGGPQFREPDPLKPFMEK